MREIEHLPQLLFQFPYFQRVTQHILKILTQYVPEGIKNKINMLKLLG